MRDDFAEAGENRKLLPTEADMRRFKGYRARECKVRKPGYAEPQDGHEFRTRLRTQREHAEFSEMMTPFWRAEDKRMREKMEATPKVRLKSRNGTEYVAEEQAEAAMRRNGWREFRRSRTVAYIDRAGNFHRVEEP